MQLQRLELAANGHLAAPNLVRCRGDQLMRWRAYARGCALLEAQAATDLNAPRACACRCAPAS